MSTRRVGVFAYGGVTSLGHYLSGGMSELAWWRHVSVWADIVLGSLRRAS